LQLVNTLLVKTPWNVVAEGVSAPADVGARRARGRAALFWRDIGTDNGGRSTKYDRFYAAGWAFWLRS